MLDLHTPRLHLIAATLAMADAEAFDRARLSILLRAALPLDWPPPLNDEASARWFIEYLSLHPAAVGWVMWYFILDDAGARRAIGNGGFKGQPSGGTVEVGYSIVPEFQRRGYATEAAGALVEWALGHNTVNRVVAETLPELAASKAVLRKLGFQAAEGASAPGVLRFERLKVVRAS